MISSANIEPETVKSPPMIVSTLVSNPFGVKLADAEPEIS